MEPKEKKQGIPTIKRALLIEDYKPCQIIMSHYLKKQHYQQVDLATGSLNAIQNIRNKSYDLIIVDINLKGCLSGKKIIQIIRESQLNVGTIIIAWSAYINQNNEKKYLIWGADAALVKSCGFKGLADAICRCSLIPRNEREFLYKLKLLRKKWKDSSSTKWTKKINDLRHLPFSILYEGVHLIREYQQRSNLHAKNDIERKNL